MADPIAPITDDYIDSVILSNAPFDPNLNKTQGIPTRQLFKNLRDYFQQQISSFSTHFKGNYVSDDALTLANPTANAGDYAFVDPGTGVDAQLYIWDSVNLVWVLSSGTGDIAVATETNAGLVALATLSQALLGTDDSNAMTALKTMSAILQEKKNVNYQVAPYLLTEVSILMQSAGNVNSIEISGASGPLLKTGITGTYPTGAQTFPYPYNPGDRLFVSYIYDDQNNPSCNLILTCQDN
jgi:hypothetical protein